MHFSKYLALAAFISTGVLATPTPPKPKPPPPPPKPAKPTPTTVSQTNQCGNGNQPFCCNTDNSGKYTSCSVLGSGSVCGATTVCCNANNSIQVCLGDVSVYI